MTPRAAVVYATREGQARKPLVPDYASWIRQARIFMEIRGEQ